MEKIEILSIEGQLLFSHICEDNNIKKALEAAVDRKSVV
jgi:hypothetical protein